MFKKIYYDIFLINLNEYPNINTDLQINVLLLGIALAICAAAIPRRIFAIWMPMPSRSALSSFPAFSCSAISPRT